MTKREDVEQALEILTDTPRMRDTSSGQQAPPLDVWNTRVLAEALAEHALARDEEPPAPTRQLKEDYYIATRKADGEQQVWKANGYKPLNPRYIGKLGDPKVEAECYKDAEVGGVGERASTDISGGTVRAEVKESLERSLKEHGQTWAAIAQEDNKIGGTPSRPADTPDADVLHTAKRLYRDYCAGDHDPYLRGEKWDKADAIIQNGWMRVARGVIHDRTHSNRGTFLPTDPAPAEAASEGDAEDRVYHVACPHCARKFGITTEFLLEMVRNAKEPGED